MDRNDTASARGLARELNEWKDYFYSRNWSALDQERAERWIQTAGTWLIDATLLTDRFALEAGLMVLRDAYAHISNMRPHVTSLAGGILALAEVAQAALDRIKQKELPAPTGQTQLNRLVSEIVRNPGITNADLESKLAASPEEVRIATVRLRTAGLIISASWGGFDHWSITPRGHGIRP